MTIEYEERMPGKQEFFELFKTTGWNEEYRLDPDELYQAIGTSWFQVCAYEGELLVGYGRLISDGRVHALILDMIVLPDRQGKGIGAGILERLVKHCHECKILDIQLFCAKGKAGFYEKYGFERRPQDAPGMQIKTGYKPNETQ